MIDAFWAHTELKLEPAQRLFNQGDSVQIKEGPFSGLQGIFQILDGESRAMVLIELLSKLTHLSLPVASLRILDGGLAA